MDLYFSLFIEVAYQKIVLLNSLDGVGIKLK